MTIDAVDRRDCNPYVFIPNLGLRYSGLIYLNPARDSGCRYGASPATLQQAATAADTRDFVGERF